jgi:hypothetical protein
MFILHNLITPLQALFPSSDEGLQRRTWFASTLLAIIVPFTPSRTSNLLRSLRTLFGLSVDQSSYYIFMGSKKLPWHQLWAALWRLIPSPSTAGRLLIALDDSINPKTGKKIFGCQNHFDHAAKDNQRRYPWSQKIVSIGLLKSIKGRWCCLPLAFEFYFMKKDLLAKPVTKGNKRVQFRTKFEQATEMLVRLAKVFPSALVLVVTDSWFGNNGLLKPLRDALGELVHVLTRMRANNTLYALPVATEGRKNGRPRKYGPRLGSASDLAAVFRTWAKPYTVSLYGKSREVLAYDRILMLKTLRCPVRVVWIYRGTQWIALVTTDLALTVEQIIEFYGARWKIESGFKEIKQEIGSSQSQTRNAFAVTNHLHFCMMATTLVWIYADRISHTPARRYATKERTKFAFGDVRRLIASVVAKEGFDSLCIKAPKPKQNPLMAVILRLVA